MGEMKRLVGSMCDMQTILKTLVHEIVNRMFGGERRLGRKGKGSLIARTAYLTHDTRSIINSKPLTSVNHDFDWSIVIPGAAEVQAGVATPRHVSRRPWPSRGECSKAFSSPSSIPRHILPQPAFGRTKTSCKHCSTVIV